MSVTSSEFESIVKYIASKTSNWILDENMLKEITSYEEWKATKTRKKRVKPEGHLAEEWDTFWNLWPSMRTFTYNEKTFTCNKPFKKNEEAMREKYNRIIDSKEISTHDLYKAALVYLANTMADSCRKGRNEMEFVSGMEPWLNQKQWRNWLNVKMPEMQEMESYNNWR